MVFIHGLWLLASSWDPWAGAFEEAGYAPLTPGWPDDPETVEEARRAPEAFAGKGVARVTDRFAEVIGGLTEKPVLVGHSFGGLIAQILAGRGLAAATVAIDPAPFRGVLPPPLAAIRTTMPVLANPANRGRAVTLTFDQFRYGWANGVGEAEPRRLREAAPQPRPHRARRDAGPRPRAGDRRSLVRGLRREPRVPRACHRATGGDGFALDRKARRCG